MKLTALRLALASAGSLCFLSAALGQGTEVKRGETIVTRDCGPCHATMRTGESRHPDAPAFRTLSKRYPIESLEEALGEGLVTGHDTPEFIFKRTEVGAIIAYLNSIQDP